MSTITPIAVSCMDIIREWVAPSILTDPGFKMVDGEKNNTQAHIVAKTHFGSFVYSNLVVTFPPCFNPSLGSKLARKKSSKL